MMSQVSTFHNVKENEKKKKVHPTYVKNSLKLQMDDGALVGRFVKETSSADFDRAFPFISVGSLGR